ncbi:hypothetical protein JCM10296v2_007594 [Rhodotorula toruloides]
MVLSPALLSPLHRFPVLWCSYRPLLRAARKAPLDEHHRLAIEQYIKREFRQWRSLRTVNKVKPKLREAEKLLHRLESTGHSSTHLERMRELAEHLILRHAKKPMHVFKPRDVPRPAPSIIRATAFNPPMQRMRPQPIKTTMMIFDRRRASQRRYDKQAVAKEFVEMASEEERIERAAGVREPRQQAMPTTRVADEWRGWIRTAQKQEQREYKRRDMRISPELYATVRGLRRSIAQKKSAAGQARWREAHLAVERADEARSE